MKNASLEAVHHGGTHETSHHAPATSDASATVSEVEPDKE
jgi:hypothetical protein